MPTRLTKIPTPEIEKQRVEIAGRYQPAADDHAGIVVETPAISFEGDLPAVDGEKAAGKHRRTLRPALSD